MGDLAAAQIDSDDVNSAADRHEQVLPALHFRPALLPQSFIAFLLTWNAHIAKWYTGMEAAR